jgi:REP element-mobilizing transposase RayT
MRDHMHLVWKPGDDYEINTLVTNFKKFTGRRFRSHLELHDSDYLERYFISDRKDRNFKFWKINSSNLLIQHKEIFIQKINYIHKNPTKGDYKTCDDIKYAPLNLLLDTHCMSSSRGQDLVNFGKRSGDL